MDCTKCIFSENVVASGGPFGGPQIGCKAGRLDTFKKKGKAECKDGVYHLDQFCNMYREHEWAALKEEKHLLETAKKEVQCSFGIVVYHEDESKEQLNKTLRSIKNIDYNKNKIGVVLSVNRKYARDILWFVEMTETMQQAGYYFRFTMHEYEDRPVFREWECFMKVANAGYLTKLNSGDCIHPSTFNIIDEEVNQKLNQIALFDHVANDISIVNKSVASHNYHNHNNFELMINDVRKQAQEGNLYLKI